MVARQPESPERGAGIASWSLRREWSRAFVILLLLLLSAAGATVVGMRTVVGEVRATAQQPERESATAAAPPLGEFGKATARRARALPRRSSAGRRGTITLTGRRRTWPDPPR
jgi:hypothetical protein